MKMKPLASGGLFGSRKAVNDASRASKKPATTWEKKKQERQDKKEEQIDKAILDTDVKLRLLKDRYRLVLERELRVARADKTKGKQNSANYSKIGVAYYSLNVVNAAQERLRELSSSRELYCCMRDMSAALSTINGLDQKIGGLNPKGIVKGMKRMTESGSGASKDLINTLSVLSGLETASKDNVPMDALVSMDVIERLINGEDVDSCVDDGIGVELGAGELLNMISDLPEINQTGEGNQAALSADDIEEATRNIASLLDQL